jgi:hypothetical protein
MNECEEQMADRIRVWVWSGFHSLSDVLEMLEDWDEDDEDDFNKQMLDEYAKSEFQAKREAEATWPAVTDCNRLDAAFDALNGIGIIALHNAGYTISDGISDVSEVLAESDRDKVKGYCFYHEQDLERAVDGHGLWLAYGDIADTAAGKRAIGELVKAELERRGFVVEWDGDEEKRIDLPRIVWQRRAA